MKRHLIALIVLLWAGNAFAEGNCPEGYFPIGGPEVQGCAPIPTSGGGYPPNPGPAWATRYGAIAVDKVDSFYAGVDGYATRGRAKNAALAKCKSNGGKKCIIVGSYSNQCGALAWGNTRAEAYRAPTAEEANQGAMKVCLSKTTNCDIFYSGCSYPERVR